MQVFDSAAEEYDNNFTNSEIGRAQRRKVWKLLMPQLKGHLDILEINCGTGEDAIEMARLGHHVVATDISPEMILRANAKHIESDELHCRFQVAAFKDLERKYAAGSFDMIFSNFGGLNCVDAEELNRLNSSFSKLLKPHGKLITVLMAKNCILERIYSLLQGRKLNRNTSPQMINVSATSSQATWFYHSSQLKKLFSAFTLNKKKPIGLFIPPSYLEPWVRKHNFAYKALLAMDWLFSSFGICADKGDHIYLSWEKK